MKNVNITYGDALDYSIYMEKEIKSIRSKYMDTAYKRQEHFLHLEDMKHGKRSFHEKSCWTLEKFDYWLQYYKIEQYTVYLKLVNFLKTCKSQNDNKPYISIPRNINKDLIHINPLFLESWEDCVKKELERLENNRLPYPYTVKE